MSRRSPVLLLTLLVTVGVLLGGCAGVGGDSEPAPRPTPIGRLDTRGMTLARVDFCPMVPRSDVRAALGAKPSGRSSYSVGDDTALTGRVTDVSGEVSCAYDAADGTTARAWIFGRPVSRSEAGGLVRAQQDQRGCQSPTAPRFGDPALLQICPTKTAGATRVRYAGLFGDTWLTCQVTGDAPLPRLRKRAGDWCVAVADVLRSS